MQIGLVELAKINNWLTEVETLLNCRIEEHYNLLIPTGRTNHKEPLTVKFIRQEVNLQSLKLKEMLLIESPSFSTQIQVLSNGVPISKKELGRTKASIDSHLPSAIIITKERLNPLDRIIFDQIRFKFQIL